MALPAFPRVATISANTKRLPAMDADKIRGAPTLYLRQIPCTPIDPVSADVVQSFGLDAAVEYLQTFIEGGKDVIEGDVLIPLAGLYEDQELRVERAAEWSWRNTSYVHLILEEDKG